MNEKQSRPILYSGPLSMFGAKAQIAALEKGIDVELVMVPFEMRTLYQPKHPEVMRVNPKQQVPVLIHGDLEIFDSTQIFEYFEDLKPQPPLWPRDCDSARRHACWSTNRMRCSFRRSSGLWDCRLRRNDPVAVLRAILRSLLHRNGRIDGRWPQLAGWGLFLRRHRLLHGADFADRMGAPMPDRAARLMAWRSRMSERPAVRQVAGAMGRYLLSQGRPLPDFLQRIVDAD